MYLQTFPVQAYFKNACKSAKQNIPASFLEFLSPWSKMVDQIHPPAPWDRPLARSGPRNQRHWKMWRCSDYGFWLSHLGIASVFASKRVDKEFQEQPVWSGPSVQCCSPQTVDGTGKAFHGSGPQQPHACGQSCRGSWSRSAGTPHWSQKGPGICMGCPAPGPGSRHDKDPNGPNVTWNINTVICTKKWIS